MIIIRGREISLQEGGNPRQQSSAADTRFTTLRFMNALGHPILRGIIINGKKVTADQY